MKKHLYIVALLSLVYCTKENNSKSKLIESDPQSTNVQEDEITQQPVISDAELFKNLNSNLLLALKEKNFVKFGADIHPEKGITFSMYGHIDPKKDKHFSPEEFAKYLPTNIKFTWGEQDGTGDPLVLSIKDYLNKWVFRKDFAKGDYFFNSFKGTGNTLNNLNEIYPTSFFTENYLSGSEEYGGMDWKSLRFVFEELNGKYYLVAVINDEWTI